MYSRVLVEAKLLYRIIIDRLGILRIELGKGKFSSYLFKEVKLG